MLLKWFDTRQAAELGTALANQFVPPPTPGSTVRARKAKPSDPRKEIQKFLQRVDNEARPLKLNLYQKSKLANSFKWRLREGGIEAALIDELTRMLLLRLSGTESSAASPGRSSLSRRR